MSEIIHCEILPPEAPDATDGPKPLAATPEFNAAAKLDEIELQEGPYLEFTRSGVKPNLAAIARRCAYAHDVAWCELTRAFLQHAEGVWLPVSKTVLAHHASGLLKQLADERDAPGLLFKRSPALIDSVLQMLKGCSPMGEPAGADAQLLPLNNGVLDLSGDEPELRGFEREDYFKAKAPINWAPGSSCKRWKEELLAPALKHPEDLSLLQRAMGSMLIAGNPGQCILLLTGMGGSGKSTAVSVFEAILGAHRIAHLRTDKLSSRFETHFFQGKDLLVAKDVGTDFLQTGGSALKWLTGADRFETEQKYGGKYQMAGTLNVIVTANEPPLLNIAGDAEAWIRRMLPIEFASPPQKRIPKFDQLLLNEEGEGILAWLVEGYLAAREEIQNNGFFLLTEGQRLRRQNFVDASQSEVVFVRDYLLPSTADMSVDEVYHGYAEMCRQRGWPPKSERKLQNTLRELMLGHHGLHPRHDILRAGKAVRGYRGIQARPKEDDGEAVHEGLQEITAENGVR